MYNPKFDYQPVPRVVIEGKRFYATPDGNKYEGFKFLNPNERDRCGCGKSFRI